jgi:hypothetical protein
MRGAKDSNGRVEHVLSAFCGDVQTALGHDVSRDKGLEIDRVRCANMHFM